LIISPGGYADDVVFRGPKGKALTGDDFSRHVRKWADKAAERTGDSKYLKVTPHTFRRSYRTRKDLEGADRKAVAANMGHHSMSTSEIYNLVDDDRLRAVAGAFGDGDHEEVRALVEKLLDAGRRSGLSLADIQAAIRRTLTEKPAI
jgi:integrase